MSGFAHVRLLMHNKCQIFKGHSYDATFVATLRCSRKFTPDISTYVALLFFTSALSGLSHSGSGFSRITVMGMPFTGVDLNYQKHS